jgi:hypothetical protein
MLCRRAFFKIHIWVTLTYMAIRKVVESDLSGRTDAATVTFGLKGTWFEIDLTDDEQKDLEQRLADYLEKGRKAERVGNPKRFVPETTPEERAEIRAWGREHGFEFAERGKIPKKLQQAYDEAHGIERKS